MVTDFLEDEWNSQSYHYQQHQQHENGEPQEHVPPTPPPAPKPMHMSMNGGDGGVVENDYYSTNDTTPRHHQNHTTTGAETMPPSSTARLARQKQQQQHAHADELLQVTLELERTRQQLEAEQMAHDETQSALQQSKTLQRQRETELERLLHQMETDREDGGRRLDAVERDLHRAESRVQEAEQDADLAYEIAKEKAGAKDQMEEWLHRALAEIQGLRDYIAAVTAQQQQEQQPSNEDAYEYNYANGQDWSPTAAANNRSRLVQARAFCHGRQDARAVPTATATTTQHGRRRQQSVGHDRRGPTALAPAHSFFFVVVVVRGRRAAPQPLAQPAAGPAGGRQ